MDLRPGTRLVSAVCETGIIVVRPPTRDGEIRCGGVRMLAPGEAAPADVVPADDARNGTLIGKRYVCGTCGTELLCAKNGAGRFTCHGAPMDLKTAKPLPSSD